MRADEREYREIREGKRNFLVRDFAVPDGEVVGIECNGRTQYAVVLMSERVGEKWVIGFKTYLGAIKREIDE